MRYLFFMISSNVLPRCLLDYMYFPSQKKFHKYLLVPYFSKQSPTFQSSPLRDAEWMLPGLHLVGIKCPCILTIDCLLVICINKNIQVLVK